ncbi:MAG: NAD(+)/NADH kinase [Candidatus ainarchaeum sp.]|nr:NAD(+)/NADH kinase [Candidatus ainarchaeum sp.]MDD5096776.1 NAD(+)/NADH kinase [Candidatus ainarchaeum sp.]
MKAKILHNKTKDWAAKTAKEVSAFLKSTKVQEVENGADLTITVGGDGTILYYKNELEGAVFGIGGEKSHMCRSMQHNWKEGLSAFLKNPIAEERMMLSVRMGGKEAGFAINDAVIISRDHGILEVSVSIDGRQASFEGDGVIVSTPTGSTAYCYSAGGAPMDESLDAFEIVPIAPFRRAFDPMVVDARREVIIYSPQPSHLLIDGQQLVQLREGVRVSVNKHKSKIRFAMVP